MFGSKMLAWKRANISCYYKNTLCDINKGRWYQTSPVRKLSSLEAYQIWTHKGNARSFVSVCNNPLERTDGNKISVRRLHSFITFIDSLITCFPLNVICDTICYCINQWERSLPIVLFFYKSALGKQVYWKRIPF